jgi:hypothetical protein
MAKKKLELSDRRNLMAMTNAVNIIDKRTRSKTASWATSTKPTFINVNGKLMILSSIPPLFLGKKPVLICIIAGIESIKLLRKIIIANLYFLCRKKIIAINMNMGKLNLVNEQPMTSSNMKMLLFLIFLFKYKRGKKDMSPTNNESGVLEIIHLVIVGEKDTSIASPKPRYGWSSRFPSR